MNNSGLDKEKAKIIHQADLHKVELEEEITQLTEKAERAITTALIVGGTLALTYFVVKGFSGKSSKKKKVKYKKTSRPSAEQDLEEETETTSSPVNDLLSRIGESLVNQATAILLDLAKEKLIEFLQSQQGKAEDEHLSKSDK
jgi:hypothetical protein